jgi:hypothetical protein
MLLFFLLYTNETELGNRGVEAARNSWPSLVFILDA